MESETREPRFSLAVAGALAGFGLALFGVYWDDAWHTDRGPAMISSARLTSASMSA